MFKMRILENMFCVISLLKISKAIKFSNKYFTLIKEKVGSSDQDEDGQLFGPEKCWLIF